LKEISISNSPIQTNEKEGGRRKEEEGRRARLLDWEL
jgi:hypothetical protein